MGNYLEHICGFDSKTECTRNIQCLKCEYYKPITKSSIEELQNHIDYLTFTYGTSPEPVKRKIKILENQIEKLKWEMI
jgi:hypothetical protein